MPKTIDITPNYEGMRAWLKNMARTDLASALMVNAEMGCEGVNVAELHEIGGNECPRCHHVNHKLPASITAEGAASYFCDGCDQFYLDFDFYPEVTDDDED